MAFRISQIASRACRISSLRSTESITLKTIQTSKINYLQRHQVSNFRRTFASATNTDQPYLSNQTSNMTSIESSMKQKITKEFQPEILNVRNDSSKHSHHAAMVAQGGGNGETHFFVEIVSTKFQGKTQIARHRAINALLTNEFDQGLHALSLRTKTPEEYEREQKMFNNIREGKNASD